MPLPLPRPATTMWTWGGTEAERAARRCDDLVPAPRIALHRVIDVAAPPALTRRRVDRLRVASYSHDLLDDLGRRSPRERTPGLAPPRVGQRAMTILRVVDAPADGGMTLLPMRATGRAAALLSRF
jgi:hypothetical protein